MTNDAGRRRERPEAVFRLGHRRLLRLVFNGCGSGPSCPRIAIDPDSPSSRRRPDNA